jgi:hypothetical protein
MILVPRGGGEGGGIEGSEASGLTCHITMGGGEGRL